MEPQRGRGRARGQTRAPEGQGPRPQGGPRGGGAPRGGPRGGGGSWGAPQQPYRGGPARPQGFHQQQVPVPQAQGAWAQQRPAQPRGPAPPPQQSSECIGRGSFRSGGGDDSQIVGPPRQAEQMTQGGDSALSAAHTGRGARRGGVAPSSDIKTKPETIQTKQGSTGRKVMVRSNYFKLEQIGGGWCLYQYRVDFNPPEDLTNVKRGMFRDAVRSLNLAGYIFDGTIMYTPSRLEQNPMDIFVNRTIKGELDPSGEKVRITIKLVGDVAEGDYHYLQVFNIIMRKCMQHLNLELVGRNFYDPGAKIVIASHQMELWPGYVTSIRQHENSILMCCEISHKFMRNETAMDLVNDFRANIQGVAWKNAFQQQIIGTIVLTDYNNKTYRVDDVAFDINPGSTFKRKDGSEISYAEYYQTRYGIKIRGRDQPMLISKSKPRELRAGMAETIILVPELCRMTGLTEQHRNNFQLMKTLAEHTRMAPGPRQEKLAAFSRRLQRQPEIMQELKQWHLKLADKIVEMAARIIPTERIMGGDGREYSAGPEVDWTRELRSAKMYSEIPVKYWVVIFPNRCRQSVPKFCDLLEKAAYGMKWHLGKPKPLEISDDRIGTYLNGLERALAEREEPTLFLCVVSNNKGDRYTAIKKKLYVDRAIPCQVIQARNLDSKGAMSIATKVAIQMNCKIGGAPWTVNIPLSGLMIVGYDVCHDPHNKSRSFGAMVASLNKSITRYFSTVTPHTSGEELSNDFALSIIKAVRTYEKINGTKPDKIIIYRDGVGDGQITYVYEHEVEAIKAALNKEYQGNPPKLAVIIVSKRINTRFFNDNRNPEPGTVVDDIVTLPHRYDFFIVSQCSRQGTVSPTSYNIIHDTFNLNIDKLQILTYKLTHMYFNWSGTVRVPAPCQYAHKLAFLVAQSLQRSPNPALDTVLYYL